MSFSGGRYSIRSGPHRCLFGIPSCVDNRGSVTSYLSQLLSRCARPRAISVVENPSLICVLKSSKGLRANRGMEDGFAIALLVSSKVAMMWMLEVNCNTSGGQPFSMLCCTL